MTKPTDPETDLDRAIRGPVPAPAAPSPDGRVTLAHRGDHIDVSPLVGGGILLGCYTARGTPCGPVRMTGVEWDALAVTVGAALGRPGPGEAATGGGDGWRDLRCGARVRTEGGVVVEVAAPEGAYMVSSPFMRLVEIETGAPLQIIDGSVHRRPGDARLRAMVCPAGVAR